MKSNDDKTGIHAWSLLGRARTSACAPWEDLVSQNIAEMRVIEVRLDKRISETGKEQYFYTVVLEHPSQDLTTRQAAADVLGTLTVRIGQRHSAAIAIVEPLEVSPKIVRLPARYARSGLLAVITGGDPIKNRVEITTHAMDVGFPRRIQRNRLMVMSNCGNFHADPFDLDDDILPPGA